MATRALANPAVRETVFVWEGRDRAGKTVRGEMRAGGQAVVNSVLRRQGILVTRIKKRRYSTRQDGSPTRTSRCSPASSRR